MQIGLSKFTRVIGSCVSVSNPGYVVYIIYDNSNANDEMEKHTTEIAVEVSITTWLQNCLIVYCFP